MTRQCITHHYACECREAKFAEIKKDAVRLAHIGKHGLDNQRYSNHVLRVGGDGDLADIRTFIDEAMLAAAKESGQ